jgi:4-amino-4-deoxy-L-arabinose transferase-like glycosyltransferase
MTVTCATPLRRRLALNTVLMAGLVGGAAMLVVRLALYRASVMNYDDGVYWQSAHAIGDGNRPYTQVFHAQPPLFAWLISWPFQFLPDGAAEIVVRVEMLALTGLLILATAGIARRFAGKTAALLTATVVCWVPIVQEYSNQFGADIPAAALGAAGVYVAIRAAGTPRATRSWLAAGALLSAAAWTKVSGAVVVIPLLVLALAGTGGVSRRVLAVLWAGVGALVTSGVLLALLRPPRAAWGQIFTFHQDVSAASLPITPGVFLALVQPWGLVFWPAALAACIWLVVSRPTATTPARHQAWAVLLWAVAVVPFALLYRPVFDHHLLLFVAPGAIALSTVVTTVIERTPWSSRPVVVIGLVLTAFAGIAVVNGVYLVKDVRKEPVRMAACLSTLPAGLQVVTDDQELAARAGLWTDPWLVDTSGVRSASGWLTPTELQQHAQDADVALISGRGFLGPVFMTWATTTFPYAYGADGYQVRTRRADLLAACLARG